MRLSEESYARGYRAGDNYNFAEEDRQVARGQRLRDAARQFARRGGVTTNDLGRITGGEWSNNRRYVQGRASTYKSLSNG